MMVTIFTVGDLWATRFGEIDTDNEREALESTLREDRDVGIYNAAKMAFVYLDSIDTSRKWSRLARERAKYWRQQARSWREIGQYGMSQVIWADQENQILEDENRRLREENDRLKREVAEAKFDLEDERHHHEFFIRRIDDLDAQRQLLTEERDNLRDFAAYIHLPLDTNPTMDMNRQWDYAAWSAYLKSGASTIASHRQRVLAGEKGPWEGHYALWEKVLNGANR